MLLLISATWCYNCAVYEKTLHDPEVAAYVNENFLPVFLDYDRRQDLTRIHPSVGVPVTAIFTPDGEPVVSAPGYYAKEELLANLRRTLRHIRDKEPHPRVSPDAAEPARPRLLPTAAELRRYGEEFARWMRRSLDPAYGGFGLNEKAPRADLLLRLVERYRQGETEWEGPLQRTLHHLLGGRQTTGEGTRPQLDALLELRRTQHVRLREVAELQSRHPIVGLYDPVQGGFFRYANRRDWSVPHFEKMLFENAEILELLWAMDEAFGDTAYQNAAKKTLQYLLGTLYDAQEGRLYGSQTADEVYYHLAAPDRQKVRAPPVDRTSYAVATARAIEALSRVSRAPYRHDLPEAARRAVAALRRDLVGPEGAVAFYDPERPTQAPNGSLRDNLWAASAFLAAHERWGQPADLADAERLIAYCVQRLYDPASGGFHRRNSTSRGLYREGELLQTQKDPEENALMVEVLLRAHEVTGNRGYLRTAEETAGYLLEELAQGRIEAVSAPLDRAAGRLLASGRYR